MQNGNVFADGYSHNDSGFLHRAPNSSRSGKGIVRRPTAPLTSVPEHVNGASQLRDVLVNGDNQPFKRPAIAIRTTSPFLEPNGGTTAHMESTPKPTKFDPMQAFRNSFLGKTTDNEDLSQTSSVARWKGKDKALPVVDDSMERIRQSKLSTKAIEIREWLQGKSGTGMHRTAPTSRKTANRNAEPDNSNSRQPKMGTIRSLFKNNRPPPPPKDRGPKPGQTYEIINNRVVENTEDRTVEISTWREQPVQRTKSNDDERMSIYYLSADEYPQDGEFANTTIAKVEWKVDASDSVFLEHSRAGSSRSGNKQSLTNGNVPEKEQTPKLIERQRSISIREAVSPIQRERTISPSTSEKAPSVSAKAHPIQVTVETVDNTAGSSTPVKNPATRRVSRQRSRHKDYALGNTEGLQSPLHPTRSVSTISRTISVSSVQFEGVLQSCEPSLSHIAPMLRNLGIRSVEHLKAVAKLSPTIRDREIKEDALRLGITIVEWAILLDKISVL
ncbi:hypothetical protein BDN70DRAFT_456744 [Pholiota conissans]|uniref:Uncharacterized protein n=1 Tax=Pholiota conissans TaxID=109636 RepID=A0A9P5ZCW1_9AGAR|nr:hypothetical protein BDN70DRAFT_456744 [Pholiota conissans]